MKISKFKYDGNHSGEKVLKCIDEDQLFKCVISDIDFSDITSIYGECINALNNLVETTFDNGYAFMDLSYRIVGFNEKKQTVDIEVSADASEYLKLIDAQVFEDDAYKNGYNHE
jgi:hypothetical protein